MSAEMSDKCFEQIMVVRASGKVNMFNRVGVQREAHDSGFYELVIYIEEHPKEYSEFILNGRRP